MRSREALEQKVLALISELMSHRRRALCAHPLYREVSLPQLHILMTLQDRAEMTVSELANLLQISTPSASSIIDRMAEHVLISRVRDVSDRRVVHVQLSERGRSIVDELIGMRRDQMQRLFGLMTEEELLQIIRAMEAVRRALVRLDGAADGSEPHALSM